MMFADRFALVALSALAVVSAQDSSNSTWKIDPSTVDSGMRIQWCAGQQNSCITLCGGIQGLLSNDCDVESLNFLCVCQGGSYPDMNEYEPTMPSYVCEQLQANCIATAASAPNAQAATKNCTDTIGSKCPTKAVEDNAGAGVAPTSSSAAPTSTSGPQTTSSAPTSSSSGGASMPTGHIQAIGNGAAAVAIGLLAYAL